MKSAKLKINSFSEFLEDPMIAMCLILLALTALMLAVLDFGHAIS